MSAPRNSGRGPNANMNRGGPRPVKTIGILKQPIYTKFSDVGRTIHIDNCIESYNAQKLLVYGLHPGDRTHLAKDKTRVRIVWFKMDKEASKQDWYGNVCFVIDFKKLVDRFGGLDNLYYVEEIEFVGRSYSRVLLSQKDAKHLPKTVTKMDFNKKGSPIIRHDDGTFSYMTGCRRTDGNKTDKHGIEFMVDAKESDLKWLYKFCTKRAVNHSECNQSGGYSDRNFAAGKCRKFNSGSEESECPYCLTEEQTDKILRHDLPGLLGPGMVDEMPDITKLSIK